MNKVFSHAELVDLRMRFFTYDDDIIDFHIEETAAPRFFENPDAHKDGELGTIVETIVTS